jgi:hypothetical protein
MSEFQTRTPRPEWLFNKPGEQKTYTPETYIPVVTPVVRWTKERWSRLGAYGKLGVVAGVCLPLSAGLAGISLAFPVEAQIFHVKTNIMTLPATIVGGFGGVALGGLMGAGLGRGVDYIADRLPLRR